MRILVTGATGVIGQRAIPLMLAGHQVTAIGRSPAGRASLEQQGAATLALDLFDRLSVRRAIAGHRAVVNLATHVPPGFRAFLPGAWKQNDRIRKLGSALLVEEAVRAGAELFVQESFLTYPDSGDRWVTEAMAPRAARYNRTSLDAESSALRFAAEGGRGVPSALPTSTDPTTISPTRWLPVSVAGGYRCRLCCRRGTRSTFRSLQCRR